jgi:hypothetical protein
MLSEELSVLADPPASCNHYACGLLDRVALEAAAELRRAAARAGLNLAGEQLLQPRASLYRDEERRKQEVSDEVSSKPTE